MDRRVLRLGAMVILLAIAVRLVGNSALGTVLQDLDTSRLSSAILFFQTGRLVRTAISEETVPITEPDTAPVTEPALAVFSPEDASLVQVNNNTEYRTDTQTALLQPLSWQLKADMPTVLILHTHGTESYTKTEDYNESATYRTHNTLFNVVSIGDRLEALLENAGIRVIHDRTMYDVPSYSGSYDAARTSIEAILAENPSIDLVLDIHRDAAESTAGSQIAYTVPTDAGEAAKLMLVIGTDGSGLTHPDWQENFSLAVKLQAKLEALCPGICRPIHLRKQRFNQDLSAGSLLIEVGATGNTRQEALLATEYLAEAILSLSNGST